MNDCIRTLRSCCHEHTSEGSLVRDELRQAAVLRKARLDRRRLLRRRGRRHHGGLAAGRLVHLLAARLGSASKQS